LKTHGARVALSGVEDELQKYKIKKKQEEEAKVKQQQQQSKPATAPPKPVMPRLL
jgi:hypothetical protein